MQEKVHVQVNLDTVKQGKNELLMCEARDYLEKLNVTNKSKNQKASEMGAPKGNQFWKLRSKHGRDKLFATADLLWEEACEYFKWCVNNPLKKQEVVKYRESYEKIDIDLMRPFTMEGLCLYLNCNKGYFNDFERGLKDKKDKQSKDFSIIITRIREAIYQQKFEGASVNLLNANIIARDLGLTDKKELKHEGLKLGEDYESKYTD